MTVTTVGHIVHASYLKPRVSTASHADTHASMQFRGQAAAHCMLQAGTCVQPKCVYSGRQLHSAFRPGSAQLQQQAYSCQLSRPLSATALLGSAVVTAAVVTAAATDSLDKAASANSARVKAAFAEAGLSQDAINYILARYPPYQRWNVEHKLLPVMQRKQQELGASFPTEFSRTPKLLLATTEVKAAAQAAGKAAKVKAANLKASRLKAAKVQAATDRASHVKAAFVEAGLVQDAIDHILTQYPSYLRWDVEQKLLPAMRRWQQKLGASFLSEFQRIPTLLNMEPEKEDLKDAYLMSIGVTSPTRLRQRSAMAFNQSLASMQGRVAFLCALGFTPAQVTSLLEKCPDILQHASERIEELLRVIGDIFDCAQDMDAVVELMLSCKFVGLCAMSPTILRHNLAYFCTCIGVDEKGMARAWKFGLFAVPPAELDIRLNCIAAQLGATIDESKSVVRSKPAICTLLPATVGLHVTQLLGLGFSHSQVKSLCLRQPSLLTLNFESELQMQKWAFLTCVLQLSHDAIAAKPHLLMLSLPKRLGPRWEYLHQLRLHGVLAFNAAHDVINSLASLTDAQFTAKYRASGMRMYDERFQKQWQKRWHFLLIDQQLSIPDIADHPDLLHII